MGEANDESMGDADCGVCSRRVVLMLLVKKAIEGSKVEAWSHQLSILEKQLVCMASPGDASSVFSSV